MMGVAMQLGEGERLESTRRRKFWKVVGGIMAAGAVTGFIAGFMAGHRDIPVDQVWAAMPEGLAVAIVIGSLIAFNVGCWLFVKSIDEVELADNLWASTAGYYVYAMLFPAWWALGKAGVTPEPDHWIIFAVSLAGGGVAYLWRKWRAR